MRELPASITTVVPLAPDERQILASWVKKRFSYVGEINFLIDKKILGGIIIQVGDQVIDKSLASILTELSEKLTA